MLRITDRILIPEGEITVETSRSGGPGGQNVNKVNSKVQIRWNPATTPSLPEDVRSRLMNAVQSRLTKEGELLISSTRTRDQAKNLSDCLDKLRSLIVAALRPPKKRVATRPTLGSKERRLESKTRRSSAKRGRRPPSED